MDVERIISLAFNGGASIGAVDAMVALGVSSGELTERQALKTYGAWLQEAITKGDIKPCRYGNRTRWYSVTEILRYRTIHQIKAKLI